MVISFCYSVFVVIETLLDPCLLFATFFVRVQQLFWSPFQLSIWRCCLTTEIFVRCTLHTFLGWCLQKSAICALCRLLVRFRIDDARVLPRANTEILFEEVIVGGFRPKTELFNRYRSNGYWVALRLDPPNAISYPNFLSEKRLKDYTHHLELCRYFTDHVTYFWVRWVSLRLWFTVRNFVWRT